MYSSLMVWRVFTNQYLGKDGRKFLFAYMNGAMDPEFLSNLKAIEDEKEQSQWTSPILSTTAQAGSPSSSRISAKKTHSHSLRGFGDYIRYEIEQERARHWADLEIIAMRKFLQYSYQAHRLPPGNFNPSQDSGSLALNEEL